MKTRRFCPHCGRPVVKSNLRKSFNKYDFQCWACDEDFWRFEVLRTKDLPYVKALRRATIEREAKMCHRIRKPYTKHS